MKNTDLEDQAREFDKQHPTSNVSQFACRFTGMYKEAAEALRKVRGEGGVERGSKGPV